MRLCLLLLALCAALCAADRRRPDNDDLRRYQQRDRDLRSGQHQHQHRHRDQDDDDDRHFDHLADYGRLPSWQHEHEDRAPPHNKPPPRHNGDERDSRRDSRPEALSQTSDSRQGRHHRDGGGESEDGHRRRDGEEGANRRGGDPREERGGRHHDGDGRHEELHEGRHGEHHGPRDDKKRHDDRKSDRSSERHSDHDSDRSRRPEPRESQSVPGERREHRHQQAGRPEHHEAPAPQPDAWEDFGEPSEHPEYAGEVGVAEATAMEAVGNEVGEESEDGGVSQEERSVAVGDEESAMEAPPPHEDAAAMARYVVHLSDWTAMATISSREPTRGMPFANVFSVADGTRYRSTGVPYLYLTDMEISVHDLRANNNASLTMSLAQSSYCKQKDYDPESPLCAHVILTGRILQMDETDPEYAFARDALFTRHPEMSGWPAGHHFFVAQLEIVNIIVLDYFGGAKTVSPRAYFAASPFTVDARRSNDL